MTFRSLPDIIADATAKGMRRALVIVAIQTEMQAVLAHLSDVDTCTGKKGIIYECGRLPDPGGDWQVIVAQSGPGNHSAQHIATTAHNDFEVFDLQLFVGIAGSLKDDVPIGSVVAGDRVYNAHSGKISEAFVARPHSVNTTFGLVQAAHKVSRDGLWQARVRPPLRMTLPAQDQYPCPMPPASHVAAIAAGEQVLASDRNAYYAQIRQHLNDAYVVEMEGYGAMFGTDGVEGTPAIIVRGVSDMCFGKTPADDAVRQPVAAAHAAAFAFELLAFWGNAQPTKRLPVTPGEVAPAPERARSGSQTAPETNARVTVVFSFDGNATDFSDTKIAQILDVLKRVSGDSDLRLESTESGSFHMLVSVRLRDLQKLQTKGLRQELDGLQAKLVGVVTESDYRAAANARPMLANPSHELMAWPRALPNGTWIERPELATILEKIESEESSVTVLLGAPGSGKSALLSSLCNILKDRAIPFLGIKADVLAPSIATEQQLKEQLGLPLNPTTLLESLSGIQPVVLVIDQLDALASFMDLKTGRLNVLLNIIRRLGQRRNIHIVLSARTFEFEHDVRLRSISAESISLELPPWHTVLEVLEKENINAQGWPEDARDVLRYPQALNTLLQLKQSGEAEAFRTYQAMLERLWTERILRAANGTAMAQLAMDIAEAMSDEETLWLAAARFDDRSTALDELDAAGIITRSSSGASIGFRHQTLFDHALARMFVRQKGKLSSYILERQPSLFIRPKIWAALTYLREVEPQTYQAELEAIWGATGLRTHLRILLIDFLGHHAAPLDFEERLLLPLLLKGEHRATAFRAIAGSKGWFERLAHSAIAAAMTEPPENSWLAEPVIHSAWSFSPDKVTELLEKFWISNQAYDTHTWIALEDCPNWTERTSALASRILDRTQVASLRVDHLSSAIAVKNPDAALQLVQQKLDFDLAAAIATKEPSPPFPEGGTYAEQMNWSMRHAPDRHVKKLYDNHSDWNSLPSISETAPDKFLQVMWSWFLSVFSEIATAERGQERFGFSLPYAIDFFFDDDEGGGGRSESSLLASLRLAIEGTARGFPDTFLRWTAENAKLDLAPVQGLIAHGFLVAPERYAAQALEFLLDDVRRFHLGGISDSTALTTRLIGQLATYWKDEEIARLEKGILAYNPTPPSRITEAEARFRFTKMMRSIRLDLLCALPTDKLSDATRRLIVEERRVFPEDSRGGVTMEGGFIGSPMESEAMRKASDEDILNLFDELPDEAGWDHPRDWRRGGNIQLSRAFADFAKSAPERGARLIRQLKPGVNERAAGYALEAMAEEADPNLIVNLLVELVARGFNKVEFRGSAAHGVERLVNRKYVVGENVVRILEDWLATPAEDGRPNEKEASENEAVEEDDTSGTPKEEDEGQSVLWNDRGFSVLPQGNYPILAVLIHILLLRGDAERERLLKILEAHLERETDVKVWKAMLRYLDYVPGAQLVFFVDRMMGRFPELAFSDEGVRLLAHMFWAAPELVRKIIQPWPAGDSKRSHVAYGELITLMAIATPEQTWALDAAHSAIGGSNDEIRTGIAFATVNLWEDVGRRAAASNLLVRIMPRASRQTWHAIFDLFRVTDELVPDEPTTNFLRALASNRTNIPGTESSFVVQRLQTLLPHNAELIGRIAQALVDTWKTDLADLRTGTSGSASELVDLAVTLHRLGGETREMGTALFESLITLNAYGARQTLDEIDNRFRTGTRRSIPRLPRRTPRRRRAMRALRAGRR